jgi:2-polyprenyl-6-hydroxyphenyl methylase/3-demethylubiquinone-9 3-methyltransferase
MKQLMANAGLTCLDVEGLAFTPNRGLHLSEDLRLNYLVAATR